MHTLGRNAMVTVLKIFLKHVADEASPLVDFNRKKAEVAIG
jgi:hypothetical protein